MHEKIFIEAADDEGGICIFTTQIGCQSVTGDHTHIHSCIGAIYLILINLPTSFFEETGETGENLQGPEEGEHAQKLHKDNNPSKGLNLGP